MDTRTVGPAERRGLVAAVLLLLVAGLTVMGTARAATPGEATGPTGQKLTVSETKNIDPAGQKVTVTGTGYDVSKGIYLAVCAVPRPGEAPSPCLGGADMSGASGTSYWINNSPYGEGLAKKFTVGSDGKGSFTLELTIKVKDGSADCSQIACAVVTRADHTHIADREQDVIVPFTFGTGEGPNPEVPPGTVRHQTVRTIEPADGAANDAAVDPAAGRLYVSTSGAKERLTVYDTATGRPVGAPVDLPEQASALALDAPAKTLYLALGDRIATYDTEKGTVTHNRVTADGNISLLAADPGAGRIYVGVQATKSVSVYDTGRWARVGEPVVFPVHPSGLVVDTAAHIGYATYVGPNRTTTPPSIYNMLNGIDGSTGRLVSTLSLGTGPLGSMGVTVDPTTRTGYVANIGAGSVSVVDLRANKVTGTLSVGAGPKSLAYDPGTGTLYAAQTTDLTVAAVDPAKNEIIQLLETGRQPEELALDTRTHTLYTVLAEGRIVETQRRVSPKVTKAPKPVSVTAGAEARFTATASGTPGPATSWEVSTDDGTSWQPVAGATAESLAFRATAEQDGNQYRAVFSNPVGSLRTAAVLLSVAPGPGGETGGSTDGGSTDGGSDAGGSDTGGSGAGGSDTGGSGTGGSSAGGSDSGGTAGGGSDTGGSGAGGSAGGHDPQSTGGGSVGGGSDGKLASTGTSLLLPLGIAAAALSTLGAAAFVLRRRVAGAR
ncbi:endoglucanase [Streptomyces sp. NPDC051018]|uniref:endoglucanase n=1 Tax=Streptomyces sp. NPDC051018 TaxID=3365639 RepID=UPI0037B83819